MPDKKPPDRLQQHLRWQRRQRQQHRLPIATSLRESGCPSEINVGTRVRKLREEQGLSIRALAEKSGLAVNTLSLIENGKTSPSVSTLQQLALALDVHITAFFDTGIPRKSIVYTRAGQGVCATFDHGTVEDLGVGLIDRTIETFIFTMEPNVGSGPNPIVHSGQEFVFCLEGRIAYMVEDHTFLLEPGDSLTFEAHLPHRWHNVNTKCSKAILVFCSFDVRDRACELHFSLADRVRVDN